MWAWHLATDGAGGRGGGGTAPGTAMPETKTTMTTIDGKVFGLEMAKVLF